jgi:hypothetical protein
MQQALLPALLVGGQSPLEPTSPFCTPQLDDYSSPALELALAISGDTEPEDNDELVLEQVEKTQNEIANVIEALLNTGAVQINPYNGNLQSSAVTTRSHFTLRDVHREHRPVSRSTRHCSRRDAQCEQGVGMMKEKPLQTVTVTDRSSEDSTERLRLSTDMVSGSWETEGRTPEGDGHYLYPEACASRRDADCMRGTQCYEPSGLTWTEEELLDAEEGGVSLEGWETGHVTRKNVDQ